MDYQHENDSNLGNSNETKTTASLKDIDTHFDPPADGGKSAWQFLAALFVLETIIWGYATSFGVLLNFYEDDKRTPLEKQPNSNAILALVGTINSGIIAFAAPFFSLLMARTPAVKRPLMIFGLAIFSLSMFLSSYATSPTHVLWSQGVGYGIGGSALYYPALSYLPEWFVARQGLANGIVFSGTGLGGLIFPLLLSGLLSRFSIAVTLKIITAVITVPVGAAIFFIRPRNSQCAKRRSSDIVAYAASGSSEALRVSLRHYTRYWSWTFSLYLCLNTLQSTSYYLPGLYLPSYVHSLGLNSATGSAMLSAINGGTIISRPLAGLLSDHYSPYLIGSITSFLGGFSVVIFWGFLGTHGIPSLAVFSFIFGCTAGAWTSLYFSVVRKSIDNHKLTMPFYGLVSLTQGLGTILSGPISSALTPSSSPSTLESSDSFPLGPFSKLIWFTGLILLGTGLAEIFLWAHLRCRHVSKTIGLSGQDDEKITLGIVNQ